MSSFPVSAADVLIVGAGPVGLMLACELQLAGCAVRVLEQAEQSDSPSKRPPLGLRGLSAPSIEHLDRRDLLVPLQHHLAGQPMPAAHWMQAARQPAGHFAGIPFFLEPATQNHRPWQLPGAAQSLLTDMASIEATLEARALALGVVIQRGCAVRGVAQEDQAVRVQTADGWLRAPWLVGCDGGRSMVRKALAIDMVGTTAAFTGYSLVLELAEPEQLPAGRHATAHGMYTYTPPGLIALVDFDGGAHHRRPVSHAHAQAVLRKVTGTDLVITSLRQAATWTDRAQQARLYRKGRVLLAGDAAHIHSPLGGQGLNLGLGDAVNLGWKLAAVVRDDAPATLIDSYAEERQPVAARVLETSRAQVSLMRPDPGSRVLRTILQELMQTYDGADYFARRMSGVDLRYDLGIAHPLVGRSAPDFPLSDGSRLNQQLRSGRAVLLDFGGRSALAAVAAGWRRRLIPLSLDSAQRQGLHALLVRPDGIVAWACEGPPDIGQLATCLTRWCGRPSRV